MIGRIAALGCILYVAFLFGVDAKKRGSTSVSWCPLLWMFLAGSRYISSWLSLSSPLQSVDAYSEGSPVDRAVFFGLILWGVVILSRRKIDWGKLLTQNPWIVLYLLYCLSSVVWTDDPLVLLKRWTKDLGNPIMALVMLTESRPYEAVGTTMRRLAFLLLPFSLLFVRYFPELGRTYDPSGTPLYTGVGHQKNDLGKMCLIAGIYFAWKLFSHRSDTTKVAKADIYDFSLIAMMAWLLRMSDSQTSISCLVMTAALLLIGRLPILSSRPSRIVWAGALVAASYFALDSTLHIREFALGIMGRNASLTDRTDLWATVSSQAVNPVVGAGFMSFWTGRRMQAIWNVMGAGITQAHNGYLEQYVNLGYVGVAFIVIIMLSSLFKIRRELNVDPAAGQLRLCLLATSALYNYTEASFYGVNNMWVLLLVACIDVSGQTAAAVPEFSRSRPKPAEMLRARMTRAGSVPAVSRARMEPRG